MTLRAGSYDPAPPDWRGIIRDDGWGLYRCTHSHIHSKQEAKDCARLALAYFKGHGQQLPPDWEVIRRG